MYDNIVNLKLSTIGVRLFEELDYGGQYTANDMAQSLATGVTYAICIRSNPC